MPGTPAQILQLELGLRAGRRSPEVTQPGAEPDVGLLPTRSGLFLAPKVLLALVGLGTAGQPGRVLLRPEKTQTGWQAGGGP